MDKAVNVPINTNNWLVFSLYTFQGEKVVGAVTGDFAIDLLRNGVNVTPAGIYIHELGQGRYHASNSVTSSVPYRSAAEEQIYLRVQHNVHDSTKLFSFWAYDLVGRVETIVQDIIDEAFAEAAPPEGVMGGYLTRDEIETRLGEVRAAITKARTAQSYDAKGMSVQGQELVYSILTELGKLARH